ncbi:MAG: IclR family transcriptional regulator [Paracoccaceae bacterium]|nr:IclR family transcriptional regulator [Paracoccaceae bacterium]MDG2257043.1 IclR family transcriptional regulator [Paracoccaceae bacterium]
MTSDSRIPTNLRILLILEVFANSDRAMSAQDVHSKISLPYQTVHRLLASLETEGFLAREANDKRFRPTRRLRQIGSGLLHVSEFYVTRHQILTEVARQTAETVNFVVPQENGMHYLDRVETDWAFRVQLPRGSNVPFHCTASGKAFMASLGKTPRAKFVGGLKLEPRTANTLTNEDELLTELAATKKRGYSIDNEEFMEGMVAIAVPIVDDKGRFVGSLATHGPTSRLPIEKLLQFRPILVEGAATISKAMF